MGELSWGWMLAGLVLLLVLSGFFSMAETSMIALDRYRLKHLAAHRSGARRAQFLLQQTERLLSMLLLGNNLLNAAAASIVTVLVVRWVGGGGLTLTFSTLLVTLVILVFSEITPKIIGATWPEPIALRISFILVGLLWVFSPVIWFINLFVRALLFLMGLRRRSQTRAQGLGLDELRLLVLEGGGFLSSNHQDLILNLLELNQMTVEDVMTPRSRIEGVDIDADMTEIMAQLGTARHTLQLLYRGTPDAVVGVVHVRKIFNLFQQGGITREGLMSVMRQPYFIPEGTALLTQLQNFQKTQHKVGLVVDEYGELLGWVTVEDILEEIVGEFSGRSHHRDLFTRESAHTVLVDGDCSLRDLNRKVGTAFPVNGPKTLNGLILEILEDIPEPGTALKVAGYPVEIVQTQDRRVRVARVHVTEEDSAAPTQEAGE
ncbi:CNNM domain-containing protein [Ferrovum sp.]|uniref:HlyC/CorC family transporter n=1 Tax=Ferrovum sp. TaxID=2609467 RepID=UPI00261AD2EA|nr:CNNM domain-containing protein [Ferrovum sp.]